MIKFQHIYENEQGFTCFDKYFSYLESISNEMSPSVYSFVGDVGRYELNGKHTLHDSLLESFSVDKSYLKDGDVRTTVNVNLLLAHDQTSLKLIYSNVLRVNCNFEPEFWPLKPVDLLTHEFTKGEAGTFRHLIEFDRGVWFDLVFSEFDFYEGLKRV